MWFKDCHNAFAKDFLPLCSIYTLCIPSSSMWAASVGSGEQGWASLIIKEWFVAHLSSNLAKSRCYSKTPPVLYIPGWSRHSCCGGMMDMHLHYRQETSELFYTMIKFGHISPGMTIGACTKATSIRDFKSFLLSGGLELSKEKKNENFLMWAKQHVFH